VELDDLDRDPIVQLGRWMSDAIDAGLSLPNAMTLASVEPTGTPSIRMVLLKAFDDRGLVFYTNYSSRKGAELTANPKAAAVLDWASLERQVSVRGDVEIVDGAESDAYFATRPRGSQIAAWASKQSSVLSGRSELDDAVAEFERRFEGAAVPRPEHWGGFRIVPVEFEFWRGRPNRLHDRVRYTRAESGWRTEGLAP
jgi:pyridoxamine 5'-phosphate oxidase